MARQRIAIDREQFEELCGLQCSLDDIAGFFECSGVTVERWCKREYKRSFKEVYKKYSVIGKKSLRKNQFRLAEKSTTMAIFLGKQYLGQSNDPVGDDIMDRLDALEAGDPTSTRRGDER